MPPPRVELRALRVRRRRGQGHVPAVHLELHDGPRLPPEEVPPAEHAEVVVAHLVVGHEPARVAGGDGRREPVPVVVAARRARVQLRPAPPGAHQRPVARRRAGDVARVEHDEHAPPAALAGPHHGVDAPELERRRAAREARVRAVDDAVVR